MSILDRLRTHISDPQPPAQAPAPPPPASEEPPKESPAPPAAPAAVAEKEVTAESATKQVKPPMERPAAEGTPRRADSQHADSNEIEVQPEEAPEEEYDPISLNPPSRIEHVGIRKDFLMPHALKTVSVLDSFTVNEAAEKLCIPVRLTDELLREWKDLKCLEVLASTGYSSTTRRYAMTSEGRVRAKEYIGLNAYVGPVPVPIDTYRRMVERQSVLDVKVTMDSLRRALSHLVISDRLLKPLGPAVNSGRTVFLYGPPGTGKTAIATALSSLLGGAIAIPKAIEIDGFVMRLFDPSVHKPEGEQPADRRWIRTKRPVVVSGGELTLDMMELQMDRKSNTYEAPPHVKSNNGIFILDDFGRQLVRPRDLLNRWIVPLENRVDYLTLHTGTKARVPFDQLVIFSTNINPKDLLDDAFMRRLRHKVYVGPLALDEFHEAFRRAAKARSIEFSHKVFEALLKEVYIPRKIPFNGCHPRDLLDHLIDIAKFEGKPPVMSQELLLSACESYFVKIGAENEEYSPAAGVTDLLK